MRPSVEKEKSKEREQDVDLRIFWLRMEERFESRLTSCFIRLMGCLLRAVEGRL